jgi:hypothetical protein
MYIPVQENENKDYSNFLNGFFQTEETFGSRVQADIDAIQKADKTYTMSKTTKALIGVGVLALVVGGGYLLVKKMKK